MWLFWCLSCGCCDCVCLTWCHCSNCGGNGQSIRIPHHSVCLIFLLGETLCFTCCLLPSFLRASLLQLCVASHKRHRTHSSTSSCSKTSQDPNPLSFSNLLSSCGDTQIPVGQILIHPSTLATALIETRQLHHSIKRLLHRLQRLTLRCCTCRRWLMLDVYCSGRKCQAVSEGIQFAEVISLVCLTSEIQIQWVNSLTLGLWLLGCSTSLSI